jgi:hypothetical protein
MHQLNLYFHFLTYDTTDGILLEVLFFVIAVQSKLLLSNQLTFKYYVLVYYGLGYFCFFCMSEIDDNIMWCNLLKLHHFVDSLYDFYASLMALLMGDSSIPKMFALSCFAQKFVESIRSFNHIRKAANDLHKHNKFVCEAILEFKEF